MFGVSHFVMQFMLEEGKRLKGTEMRQAMSTTTKERKKKRKRREKKKGKKGKKGKKWLMMMRYETETGHGRT